MNVVDVQYIELIDVDVLQYRTNGCCNCAV